MSTLDLKKTALVIIDLQKSIAGRDGGFAPYTAAQVLENNDKIAKELVNTDALIVFVHVNNNGGEVLRPIADNAPRVSGVAAPDAADFVSPIAYDENVKNVIHVSKHNWGAFYGTDLDVQLRRRGITDIILTGIATTIGVDTTAREAYQHGYNVISVEDAMTDFNGDLHKGIVDIIFKRLGRVRLTDEVVEMIKESK